MLDKISDLMGFVLKSSGGGFSINGVDMIAVETINNAYGWVISLVKEPEPLPSVVCSFDIVGFCEVFQQTPLTKMDVPPSLVILPPLMAEL